MLDALLKSSCSNDGDVFCYVVRAPLTDDNLSDAQRYCHSKITYYLDTSEENRQSIMKGHMASLERELERQRWIYGRHGMDNSDYIAGFQELIAEMKSITSFCEFVSHEPAGFLLKYKNLWGLERFKVVT